MSACQRRKGHNFERLIARKVRELGIDARRGMQSRMDDYLGPVAAKEPDIMCGPPLDRFWVECKTGARPNIWAAMEQAVRDAPRGITPVVVVHRDRGRTLVCLELEDALELVREGARG